MSILKKNCIYALEKGADRFLHWIMVMLCLVSVHSVLTSCGKDEKNDEPKIDEATDLYGMWVANVTGSKWQDSDAGSFEIKYEIISTILFNSQGKLLRQEKINSKAEGGATTSTFMDLYSLYKVNDNIISIYRGNNGKSTEYKLSYTIIGDNLILELISGEDPSILLGESRIVYTNKSRADIIEYPYGSWKATLSTGNVTREFSLSFNLDNELSFSEKKQDNQYFTTLEDYRYEFSGNTMELYNKYNTTTRPDCILSFKVNGNNIQLVYMSGEKPLFISLFEKDDVIYTTD